MMSRYKLGLATAQSALRVGASTPGGSWNFSDYHDVAEAMWNKADKSQGTAAVVIIYKDGGLDGATPTKVLQFATGAEASQKYDATVNSPGSAWYIALFDEVARGPGESALRDETYLGGVNEITTVVKNTTKKQPMWPWLVGFLGLGVVYTASSKKKGGGL